MGKEKPWGRGCLFHPILLRVPEKSIEEAIQSAGDIRDISTCAANTIATGLGITTANPGRKATFTITSRDSQNFQRKLGGDVFEVKLKPKWGGDEIKVELNDQKNGTYLAEYTVDKMYRKLTLSVFLRGAHIKCSPFSVLVEYHDPNEIIVTSRRKSASGIFHRRRLGRYEGRNRHETTRDQATSSNEVPFVTFD